MLSAQPNQPATSSVSGASLDRQEVPSVGREDFHLFGPLGIEAYQRYQPGSPNQADYAIKQIRDRYADAPENQKAIAARETLWANYDRLKSEFNSASDLPAVETIFHLLKEISPLAKTQLEGQRSGLGVHLLEVTDFCRTFFQTSSGSSRFPGLISDRRAALLAEVIAPLHDALKYLGTPDSQIMPDHEVLTAELVRQQFTNRLVTFNGKAVRITNRDAEFIAAVIGDHENINKELGRSHWSTSRSSVERAKALFFVADTLTGALREEPAGSNQWRFDPVQLDQRFIDLYFRHIDPVKGKIFRPEWALHAVSDLANTLDKIIASGSIIRGALPEQTPRDTLIESAIEGINRSLRADAARWEASRTAGSAAPEKYLSKSELARIEQTLEALRHLKNESLKVRLEKPSSNK